MVTPKLTISEEAELAIKRDEDEFRSQHPCKMFHLANRSSYSLECVECARLRQRSRKHDRMLARLAREAEGPEPGKIVKASMRMQEHGLRAPMQNLPGETRRRSPELDTSNLPTWGTGFPGLFKDFS